ncbi:MAG: nitronate monooxygenase [Ideonella sp.]|nr:nitronate monooxygenase [Ideonella sp.]
MRGVHRLARGLRLPVCAAPMFLVSGPELVLAACRAGIMGSFPTNNCRSVGELERWMQQISSGCADAQRQGLQTGPWCANLITHSTNTRLADDLALVARFQPPVVITALGSPKPAIEVVHGYGGLVVADVVNLPLARKAVAAGADGLACISAGAGGHTGFMSPFAFVSALREFFDGLLIIGGGIGDGYGVAGAVAAGADLVYMGTRFIPTTESLADPEYKQMVVDCDVDDLTVSPAISGTAASWLKPSLVRAGLDPAQLGAGPQSRVYDANDQGAKRWKDTWAAGQGLGCIRAIEPVQQVVDRLDAEYRAALQRVRALQ